MPDPNVVPAAEQEASRKKGPAMWRGFKGRCPRCGEGHLFRAFLKVRECCECCGEAFHHHRADDAPPYVTLLIVSHVFGFIYVAVRSAWDLPFMVELAVWPALVLVLSLLFLPRVKGALIALQWALRMHGFGDETEEAWPSDRTRARDLSKRPQILTS